MLGLRLTLIGNQKVSGPTVRWLLNTDASPVAGKFYTWIDSSAWADGQKWKD